MTLDIATHIRIANPSPDDDFVKKRSGAIDKLAAAFADRVTAPEILNLAEALASEWGSKKPSLPAPLADEVATAIRAEAPSFVVAEAPLDAFVCFALAVGRTLEAAEDAPTDDASCLAAAIHSGLSFRERTRMPRVETLRTALVDLAHRVMSNGANAARAEVAAPDIPEAAPTPKLREALIAMSQNAGLAREEIDLLWWALNARSAILAEPMARLAPPLAAVAAGFEVASKLRHLPLGAHCDLALRGLPTSGDIALKEFFAIEKEAASRILDHATASLSEVARSSTHVFPLSLCIAIAASGGPNLVAEADRVGVEQSRTDSVEGWTRRAVNEAALARPRKTKKRTTRERRRLQDRELYSWYDRAMPVGKRRRDVCRTNHYDRRRPKNDAEDGRETAERGHRD